MQLVAAVLFYTDRVTLSQ